MIQLSFHRFHCYWESIHYMFVNEEPSSQECTERGLAARRGYTRWYVYIARILPLLLPQLSVHTNS
jgi:hypothetical protein